MALFQSQLICMFCKLLNCEKSNAQKQSQLIASIFKGVTVIVEFGEFKCKEISPAHAHVLVQNGKEKNGLLTRKKYIII